MKKFMFISLTVLLLAAFIVMPAAAKPSVIKGEVTAINGTTLTVLTDRNGSVNVTVPAGFDLSTIAVKDEVLVKGQLVDGSIVADWVKKVAKGESEDDQDTGEGSKANSAYCNGSKQQPHPMAAALAKKYGVTTDWVMGYFCKGFGMGAIMLALKTHEINGANAGDLLTQRANGQGWGAIWQGLKMIGSEKDVQTPPGQLKKLDKGNQGNH